MNDSFLPNKYFLTYNKYEMGRSQAINETNEETNQKCPSLSDKCIINDFVTIFRFEDNANLVCRKVFSLFFRVCPNKHVN